MNTVQASDVRKNFSASIDSVIREKPLVIKRTRDVFVMISEENLKILLENYKYHMQVTKDEEGYAGYVPELNLVESGVTETELLKNMVEEIQGFSNDFYDDYDKWVASTNGKNYVPYVFKALLSTNDEIEKDIEICQGGKN